MTKVQTGNTIWNRIATIGVTETTPEILAPKFLLTNIISSILFVLAFAFTVLFYIITPTLSIITGVITLFFGLAIFLQYINLHIAGRFMTSVSPTIGVALFQGLLMNEETLPFHQLYYLQAVFAILPWALFSTKERVYSIGATIVCGACFLSYQWFNNVLVTESDLSAAKNPFILNSMTFAGILITVVLVNFLESISKSETEKTKQLLAEIESQNKKSLEKEKQLQDFVTQLEASQKEEQKRSWATQGIAEVGKLLRTEENMQVLTDRLISYIVKYVGANQGALFLLNNDDESDIHMEMRACYAYDRKKYIDKRVDIGQGLIGQCYLEKAYVYLADVPDDYIQITSGLGDANPTAVLLVPMIANEEVYGVIEVASFSKFETHQIKFLEDLGENIAMTLNNIRVNERTKKLLQATQEQSQQLRSQEEEMRQNMEELEAIQEQQRRQEEQLRMELDEKIKEVGLLREMVEQHK